MSSAHFFLISNRGVLAEYNEKILCTVVTLIAVLPSCLHLSIDPRKSSFILALINSSLAFYLFSFQVCCFFKSFPFNIHSYQPMLTYTFSLSLLPLRNMCLCWLGAWKNDFACLFAGSYMLRLWSTGMPVVLANSHLQHDPVAHTGRTDIVVHIDHRCLYAHCPINWWPKGADQATTHWWFLQHWLTHRSNVPDCAILSERHHHSSHFDSWHDLHNATSQIARLTLCIECRLLLLPFHLVFGLLHNSPIHRLLWWRRRGCVRRWTEKLDQKEGPQFDTGKRHQRQGNYQRIEEKELNRLNRNMETEICPRDRNVFECLEIWKCTYIWHFDNISFIFICKILGCARAICRINNFSNKWIFWSKSACIHYKTQ